MLQNISRFLPLVGLFLLCAVAATAEGLGIDATTVTTGAGPTEMMTAVMSFLGKYWPFFVGLIVVGVVMKVVKKASK